MNQQDLIDLLKTGEHTVTFTKKDGEIRTIRGFLPDYAVAKNETAVPIVESETGAWKSFIAENMVSIRRSE